MVTYTDLKTLSKRPALFSVYTADTLWTDTHVAHQMLQMHLSQDTALASRPFAAIDRVVDWIDQSFGLQGRSVCDLGCGPGLYAHRYAARGAVVFGLDFSTNSIAHARQHAPENADLTFRVANYLEDPLPAAQDIVTMIYCDLCALSPVQRQTLLTKVRHALAPGGIFIFDVYSTAAFDAVTERVLFEPNLMNRFWSPKDYFAFQHSFRYDRDSASLDRFTIIEEERTWQVYNWLTYFSRDDIHRELRQAGFTNVEYSNGFDIDPSDEKTFSVVARV